MKAKNILYIFFLISLITVFLLVSGCRPQIKDSTEVEISGQEQEDTVTAEELQQEEEFVPGNMTIYEGLHVTGKPVDVDIDEYRLKVTGLVDKELSLSFEEVKELDSVTLYAELNCPGFFIDKGDWTGTRLKNILDLAGVQEGAEKVNFISIDRSYQQQLLLDEALQDGVLISYGFNGEEFSKYHGFPLRLVAEGQYGSYWVKWLGEIEVIS